jgi:YegS/Rv2252/BmrU family lipid kinase
MKKLLFLTNPLSGKTEGQKIDGRLSSILKNHLPSKEYDIVATEPDIQNQLSHICTDYEKVVAAGGDGTISNIIQAMVSLGWKQKLGIIPLGTGNDLARSLGVLETAENGGLENLIKIILKGKTKQLDILEVNNKHICVNYFSLGNDAAILNDFNAFRTNESNRLIFKYSLGKVVYAFAGVKRLNYKIPAGTILSCNRADSEQIQINFDSSIRAILISNISSYGGGAMLSSKARTDDRIFEVTIIKSVKEWAALHLSRFTKKQLDIMCPEVDQVQTNRVDVLLPETTFCQADGEIIEGLSEIEKKIVVKIKSYVDIIVP